MDLTRITAGATGNITPPFDSVINAAKRCEDQGYEAIWWYDHLMSWWPQSIWTPDLVPPAKLQANPHIHVDAVITIGAVGVCTERVSLGTSVTEAIRRPPAVLAQEFLTLDHITKGRAILGIGAGEGCNIAPYGLDGRKPVSRLEEAIKIIRLLWEHNDPVDYDGEFWKLQGAVMGMSPYREGKYPPIWVGAMAPRSLRITGQLADGWIPPFMALDDYKRSLGIIREAAVAAGRDPAAITPAAWAYLVIGDDHASCHKMMDALLVKDVCLAMPADSFRRYGAEPPFGEGMAGITSYVPSRVSREQALEMIAGVPFGVVHDHVLHGTPDEVAQTIKTYGEAGLRHIAFQNITFAADATKVGRSFKLMGETVKYLNGLA